MTATATAARQFIQHRAKVDPFGQGPPDLEAAKLQVELAEALNKEAQEKWGDSQWERQVAADIATTLDYGLTFDNLFPRYFMTQTVGKWDRVILRERRGLKVYTTSRGGYIDESHIRDEVWELPRDTMGFHVSDHIDKFQTDFATQIADLVSLGNQRLDAEVNRRIFSLLGEAVPSGSDYYVAVNGLTKPVVDAAIREVVDAIKPEGTGPVPVTIIGRSSMVDQISDFNLGFNPIATEEVRSRGFLGTYKAANVVRVINYTDEEGASYIPANELWIFGGNVGRFAMYGPLTVKPWDENTVDYRHYRARKDVGGLVHHPEQARRIVDSSVTP